MADSGPDRSHTMYFICEEADKRPEPGRGGIYAGQRTANAAQRGQADCQIQSKDASKKKTQSQDRPAECGGCWHRAASGRQTQTTGNRGGADGGGGGGGRDRKPDIKGKKRSGQTKDGGVD